MADYRFNILAQAIVKVKLNCATSYERDLLSRWLDESEENRKLYLRIVRGESIAQRLQAEQTFVETISIDTLVERARLQIEKQQRRREIKNRFVKRSLIALTASVSACILLFFVVDLAKNDKAHKRIETPIATFGKIILQRYDGAQIDLSETNSGQVDLRQMACMDDRDTAVRWNKIITAAGGNYSFTLEDGTQVWLNASTELEFPNTFRGDSRQVKLRGEAYFEVAKDRTKPFYVITDRLQTKVLGTSFNVKAYRIDDEIATTLVSGSVEIIINSGAVRSRTLLKPGMQSVWNATDGNLTVNKVATADIVSWMKGIYVFNGEQLEELTENMSRMFDVEFEFHTISKKMITYDGSISKTDNINSVLEVLTLAGGPKFKREGRVVKVFE